MDKEIENEITLLKRVISSVLDSLRDVQGQIDEGAVLQLAMVAVLKDKVPDFEKELEKVKPAFEAFVREENKKIYAQFQERFGKWVQ